MSEVLNLILRMMAEQWKTMDEELIVYRLNQTAEMAEELERERDEAIAARKASAADWLNQIEQANARVARACRERDEAREAFAVATDQLVQAQSALREIHTIVELRFAEWAPANDINDGSVEAAK